MLPPSFPIHIPSFLCMVLSSSKMAQLNHWAVLFSAERFADGENESCKWGLLFFFKLSCSMADLTRDWDRALGELQYGGEAILCHVELLSQTATALTAISDLNGTYSSALTL